MKKNIFALAVATAIFLPGCTDGFMGKMSAYGGSAEISCYSGGKLIYQGTSTGKVTSESSSDGYYFVDSEDDKLKEVSGDCVIEYQEY